eukprot:2838266-Rhodomonas_salina.3
MRGPDLLISAPGAQASPGQSTSFCAMCGTRDIAFGQIGVRMRCVVLWLCPNVRGCATCGPEYGIASRVTSSQLCCDAVCGVVTACSAFGRISEAALFRNVRC